MRLISGLHHLILNRTSVPHHQCDGSEQRIERFVLDQQHLRQGGRRQSERTSVARAGVSVEGGMEDRAETRGAGGLLSEFGREK